VCTAEITPAEGERASCVLAPRTGAAVASALSRRFCRRPWLLAPGSWRSPCPKPPTPPQLLAPPPPAKPTPPTTRRSRRRLRQPEWAAKGELGSARLGRPRGSSARARNPVRSPQPKRARAPRRKRPARVHRWPERAAGWSRDCLSLSLSLWLWLWLSLSPHCRLLVCAMVALCCPPAGRRARASHRQSGSSLVPIVVKRLVARAARLPLATLALDERSNGHVSGLIGTHRADGRAEGGTGARALAQRRQREAKRIGPRSPPRGRGRRAGGRAEVRAR